jgi:hypothetical protein
VEGVEDGGLEIGHRRLPRVRLGKLNGKEKCLASISVYGSSELVTLQSSDGCSIMSFSSFLKCSRADSMLWSRPLPTESSENNAATEQRRSATFCLNRIYRV